jgi:pimeloyl-ACP methyl ester carboxylesterase
MREPARWLNGEVQARYRQTWRHGLQGGLNYYRASPLRPATAQDPGASAVWLPPEILHIGMPTLVLWAQDDTALLPCLTEGLAQHVPDLKLVPIAQASHWVVHEKPGQIIREITEFLKPSSLQ